MPVLPLRLSLHRRLPLFLWTERKKTLRFPFSLFRCVRGNLFVLWPRRPFSFAMVRVQPLLDKIFEAGSFAPDTTETVQKMGSVRLTLFLRNRPIIDECKCLLLLCNSASVCSYRKVYLSCRCM